MAKKKKVLHVPFKHGRMMEYTGCTYPSVDTGYHAPTEWRENYEFQAELRLGGTYRGRSAARVTVTNPENDEQYSLSLTAMFDAIRAFGALPGVLVGTWTFRKQGSNYSLVPVISDEMRARFRREDQGAEEDEE